MAAIALISDVAVRLRPITGADEAAVDPDDPAAPTALLRRLLILSAGRFDPAAVDGLTVTAHDRLLAGLFDALYGDQIEARADCPICGEAMDVSLSLAAFIAADADVAVEVSGPDSDGVFTLTDGRRFRLPTLGDIAAAAATSDGATTLRASCLLAGDPEDSPELLDAAIEQACPALARDVAAPCPHCGAVSPLRLDLPAFLIAALARERPFLLRETHLLARTYGWSHAEILALSRDDRRALAQFCEAERAVARRAA